MYSLTLQNAGGDSVITSGEILGRINFAVPSESDGSAATYIASFIRCASDGSFTSGSNPAGLIFGTSAADADPARAVLRISADGHLIPEDNQIYNLGSLGNQFNQLYANSGYLSALAINNYRFPSNDGLLNQYLKTDGNGNLSWSFVSSSGGGGGVASTVPTTGSIIRGYEVVASGKNLFNTSINYASGYLDVYQNGIKLLIRDDYTANGGSTFTLSNTVASGDIVEWIGYSESTYVDPTYALATHNHSILDITNFSSGVNTIVSGIYALLDSPTFSGIPTVPTAPSGTNTDQIASTAFVTDAVNRVQSIQGTQGFTGSQGTQGLTGSQGIQGLTGSQGVQGLTGSQGIQGLTGSQGVQGLTGSQGVQGLTGSQGIQGLTGSQGVQGLKIGRAHV